MSNIMIVKILAYFGFKKVESLSNKSNNILNVFNKTVVELDSVNNEIEQEIGTTVDKINDLHAKVATLNRMSSDNLRIKNKIKSFLEA